MCFFSWRKLYWNIRHTIVSKYCVFNTRLKSYNRDSKNSITERVLIQGRSNVRASDENDGGEATL